MDGGGSCQALVFVVVPEDILTGAVRGVLRCRGVWMAGWVAVRVTAGWCGVRHVVHGVSAAVGAVVVANVAALAVLVRGVVLLLPAPPPPSPHVSSGFVLFRLVPYFSRSPSLGLSGVVWGVVVSCDVVVWPHAQTLRRML